MEDKEKRKTNVSPAQRTNIEILKTETEAQFRKYRVIVNFFMEDNMSINEISKRTGDSIDSVQRTLSNKRIILLLFPENGEQIYNNIQEKVVKEKLKVYNLDVSEIPKLRIDIFSKNPEMQIKLLYHMALTFRVKLPILAALFQIDEFWLRRKFFAEQSIILDSGIEYLENGDITNQNIAMSNLINYYRRYVNAIVKKDDSARKELIESITDIKAVEMIKRNRESGDLISQEEIETMFAFRMKYALSTQKVASIFSVNRSNIIKLFKSYYECHPEFQTEYMGISDYNEDLFFTNKRKPSTDGRRS